MMKMLWTMLKMNFNGFARWVGLILGIFIMGRVYENRKEKTNLKIKKKEAETKAWKDRYEAKQKTYDIDDRDIDQRLRDDGWLRQ